MPTNLDPVLEHAGFALRHDRAFLRITGSDATRWLNGMVTNSIQALQPGTGSYNFLLNAQGRIQGDCLIFREPDALDEPTYLLVTDAAQVDAVQQHLDRFIIMDDVELTPVHVDQTTFLLLGPDAPEHLRALDLPTPDPLRLSQPDTPHGPVLLLTPPAADLPRYEIRAAEATITALAGLLRNSEVPELDEDTLEQLRILQGRPRFGTDIRNTESAKDLPQETNQPHALHFSKGCYLGQEIVERIHSRGQVHRIFTAFRLEGSLPPTLPALLQANGKPAGELTSAIEFTLDGSPTLLALGYARREALDTQALLTYPGGSAYPRKLGKLT